MLGEEEKEGILDQPINVLKAEGMDAHSERQAYLVGASRHRTGQI